MAADRRTPDTGTWTADMPDWVSWFTDGGRPVVAVLVMVMCAPGEHHLATMAGWENWLAWGMPGCLVIYTGIAAVVATKRAKGAPGKRTAVTGAILSLLLAMSAQPISHLFVTGIWHGDPWPLVVVVSCIPPMVLGHLLHLAAGGSVRSVLQAGADIAEWARMEADAAEWARMEADAAEWARMEADAAERTRTAADTSPEDTQVPRTVAADTAGQPDADTGTVAADTAGQPDVVPDTAGQPDVVPDTAGQGDADTRSWRIVPQPDTSGQEDTQSPQEDVSASVQPVRPISSGHLSAFIAGHLADNPDAVDADIRAAALSAFPDTKQDTIRKAVNRVRARRAA